MKANRNKKELSSTESEETVELRSFYFVRIFCTAYASAITPVGHVPAQAPQLMQLSASISNFPSPSEIAPTGHAPAQAPQDTQPSLITYAILKSSLN